MSDIRQIPIHGFPKYHICATPTTLSVYRKGKRLKPNKGRYELWRNGERHSLSMRRLCQMATYPLPKRDAGDAGRIKRPFHPSNWDGPTPHWWRVADYIPLREHDDRDGPKHTEHHEFLAEAEEHNHGYAVRRADLTDRPMLYQVDERDGRNKLDPFPASSDLELARDAVRRLHQRDRNRPEVLAWLRKVENENQNN